MNKRWLFLAVLFANSAAMASTQVLKSLSPQPHYAKVALLSERVLNSEHYKALPLNNALSNRIFDNYLEALDPGRQLFLQSDIQRLTRARTQMDDAIRNQDLQLPYMIFNFSQRRTVEYLQYARQLLKTGFDFSQQENYEYDRSKAAWPKTKAEMQDLWRKRVKSDWLLLKLAGKDDKYIRERLDKRYNNSMNMLLKNSSEDVFQVFMNAYSTALDPHTNYLAPRSVDNFNISMQLSLVGIGATLQLRDEYTTIRELVPGSPAALSKQLNVGDRIVGVGQGRNSTPVDVVGWRIDDVVALIRGDKGTAVVLDILPAGAQGASEQKRVTLIRDKIKLEEQAAKKSIVDVKGQKVGVIELPSFYRDFQAVQSREREFRSASRDVERLIRELKAEKVVAIVFDLRNNGGGALNEAVEVTGLFIKDGPVVQQHNTRGDVMVEVDKDPRVAWDGPLTVLINRASASASEIFAAAIQDYGRGVVVGDSSFGKGTVQALYNLDEIAENRKPIYGELKLTTAQFFRINGGTTQLRGVVPDMGLPSLMDSDEFGEASYNNALPWTQIRPVPYKPEGNVASLLPLLKVRHEARVAQNQEYQYLLEDLAELDKKRKQKYISLNEAERTKERKQREARLKSRKGLNGKDLDRELHNDGLLSNERDLQQDISLEKAQKETKDVLLNEAASIAADIADLQKSNTKLTVR